MDSDQTSRSAPSAGLRRRRISPLTAAGALLVIVALTGILTYAALVVPARLVAASGPPEALRQAATQQALSLAVAAEAAGNRTPEPESADGDEQLAANPLSTEGAPGSADDDAPSGPTPTLHVAVPSELLTPTAEPTDALSVLPGVDARYWLSIPSIGLEAPIVPFGTREREVDGLPVDRLLVPNTYAVSWDNRSAEPGFAGNTVLAGHNNLFGAVFGELENVQVGAEIAVWSEYGVLSYRVQQRLLLEEKDQPLEVRLQNAQWMADTPDDRLTLISCWPRETYTHRLIVVATRSGG